MGYATRHELKTNIEADDKLFSEIEQYILDNELNEWAINELNGLENIRTIKDEDGDTIYFGEEDSKWYNHQEDMIGMSKEFPTVKFMLHGEGEDRDDVWDEIYFNGEEKKKDKYDLLELLIQKFSSDIDELGFDILGGSKEDCINLEIRIKK